MLKDSENYASHDDISCFVIPLINSSVTAFGLSNDCRKPSVQSDTTTNTDMADEASQVDKTGDMTQVDLVGDADHVQQIVCDTDQVDQPGEKTKAGQTKVDQSDEVTNVEDADGKVCVDVNIEQPKVNLTGKDNTEVGVLNANGKIDQVGVEPPIHSSDENTKTVLANEASTGDDFEVITADELVNVEGEEDVADMQTKLTSDGLNGSLPQDSSVDTSGNQTKMLLPVDLSDIIGSEDTDNASLHSGQPIDTVTLGSDDTVDGCVDPTFDVLSSILSTTDNIDAALASATPSSLKANDLESKVETSDYSVADKKTTSEPASESEQMTEQTDEVRSKTDHEEIPASSTSTHL